MPPNTGGGIHDIFFVRYYVDDDLMVEVQWCPSGIRCLMASASLASDHFRLFRERSARGPPLSSARKVFVGHTAGSVKLGDRYNGHNHLTAVREVIKTWRPTT